MIILGVGVVNLHRFSLVSQLFYDLSHLFVQLDSFSVINNVHIRNGNWAPFIQVFDLKKIARIDLTGRQGPHFARG